MFKKIIESFTRIYKVLIFRFQKDHCFVRASSLTYSAALSVVPILAVMFGIAKGFGIERVLEEMLRREFAQQKEVMNFLIQFAYSLLAEARGGLIAGIGIITLLFTVIQLLSSVEESLNVMWGIHTGRSFGRKIADYLALTFICPVIFVISSSVTLFLTTQLETLTESISIIRKLHPFLLSLIAYIPFLISPALFVFVYIFLPNRKVKFWFGLTAGILAGIAYQIVQATYIFTQVQFNRAGAIYGSFAAVPLFLLWMYISWLIFLIGGEIVVLLEEREWDTSMIPPFPPLSPYEKKLASLVITKAAIEAYLNEQKAPSYEELSRTLKMPERMISELVEDLTQAKVLLKVESEKGVEIGVAPAHTPNTTKVFDVIFALEGDSRLHSVRLIEAINELLKKTKQEMESSPNNEILSNIRL